VLVVGAKDDGGMLLGDGLGHDGLLSAGGWSVRPAGDQVATTLPGGGNAPANAR
jgi:hypothetical protein